MQDDVQKSGSIFVYSDEMSWFDFGADHPFKPERAAKTYELCIRYGVMHHPWMNILNPEPIDRAILTLFHDAEYLHLLEEASQGKIRLATLERGIGTADTPILPGIFEWSRKAAGGTCAAMDHLIKGDACAAFNPLGGFHHARAGSSEGFCYINDVVVAIMDALRKVPDIKIAIVDLDAHHGNGVQEAFYNDPRVLFISIHESGRNLYPWGGSEIETGEGSGKGYTVNVPIEPGSDDEVFSFVFHEVIPPLLKAFCAHLVVAELGADTLISDPLTHLKLTNNGYRMAVKKITELSPRILALGGGGYDIYRTSRCWTLAWSILNSLEPTDEFAGLVGGMMFGPEMEVGSLYDHPFSSTGEVKETAMVGAQRVVDYIRKEIFPVHGLPTS